MANSAAQRLLCYLDHSFGSKIGAVFRKGMQSKMM
jgi:hypothetical protein